MEEYKIIYYRKYILKKYNTKCQFFIV